MSDKITEIGTKIDSSIDTVQADVDQVTNTYNTVVSQGHDLVD